MERFSKAIHFLTSTDFSTVLDCSQSTIFREIVDVDRWVRRAAAGLLMRAKLVRVQNARG